MAHACDKQHEPQEESHRAESVTVTKGLRWALSTQTEEFRVSQDV